MKNKTILNVSPFFALPILVIAVTFLSTTFCAPTQASDRFEKIIIDWTRTDSLENSVLLDCDDLVQAGADIQVPGFPMADFLIEIRADATHGTFCTANKATRSENSSSVRINGDDGCEVTIKNRATEQQAVIYFGSC